MEQAIRAAPRILLATATAALLMLIGAWVSLSSSARAQEATSAAATSTNTTSTSSLDNFMGNPGGFNSGGFNFFSPGIPNTGTGENMIGSSSTSSNATDDMHALQQRVHMLETQVALLQQEINFLIGQNMGTSTGTTTMIMPGIPNTGAGTTSTSTNMGTTSSGTINTNVQSGWIDQDNGSTKAGTSLDFGGHGFGSEEPVQVWLNGVKVGNAFTNLAGSFTTGSMSIPQTPGTYTWQFVGEKTGIMGTATVTLTQ